MSNEIKTINRGVYPAMLTPYTADMEVDYGAVKALTQWYAEKGCQGVFSTCLSSEIFGGKDDCGQPYSGLTLEERVKVAKATVEAAPASMDVVVSGHTRPVTGRGMEELKAMADTGAKALVLISGLLADDDEDEDAIRRNLDKVMNAIPDIDLGFYECPLPYWRPLSAELLGELARTGRFVFMKDTTCSTAMMKPKLDAVRGTRLQIFNANSATLLDTVRDGCAGLCGVMANYHPDLYVKLMELADNNDPAAQELMDELGVLASIQYPSYPASAKAYLQREGLPFASIGTRANPKAAMGEAAMYEIEQRYAFTNRLREKWL